MTITITPEAIKALVEFSTILVICTATTLVLLTWLLKD